MFFKVISYNAMHPTQSEFTRVPKRVQSCFALLALALGMGMSLGCGTAQPAATSQATYTLTVNSTSPTNGVAIALSGVDLNGSGSGTASFTRSFTAGTSVSLTAPATQGTNYFASWTGCSSVSGFVCTVAMNANATVIANYAPKAVYSVTISPAGGTTTIGNTVQFNATVVGAGTIDNTVTWSIAAPASSKLSPGTITNLSSTSKTQGLYTTPYPAPATVTVTATSNQDSTKFASVVVTLTAPLATVGPALNVDIGNQTRSISPLIYGMNSYPQAYGTNGYNLASSGVAQSIALPVDRWGGDTATRYNYLLDAYNIAQCCYFENTNGGATGYPNISQFNTEATQDKSTGTKTLATVPLIGWTALRNSACSFSVAKYGPQQATDPNRPDCGNGVLLNGKKVVNDPTDTSTPIDKSFVSGWVQYLVGKFGTAANGGINIYELDNEPEYWNSVNFDVHPNPLTYDELTNNGLSYAQAIKAQDATALVSGPVISSWENYFYSTQDYATGIASGPCYCYNGNPTDRLAHGDVPLIEYYLQKFQAYQSAHGVRLLDYLDIHTYFTANNLALNPATGDTTAQQARLNSTRVFWDPTYTDPNYTDPNNRTTSAPPYPPQIIPLMRSWVAKDYPGTKTAITEYNWGGMDGINGGLAQADLFGIFGREGLDLATLWNPPDPIKQAPGLAAFKVFRNYDGAGSQFGDMALASTSGNQGQLSVYAARRTADHAVTIVVINKTYGDLTSKLSLANLTTASTVKAFLYSNANPAAIVPQANLTLPPPPSGSSTSSLTTTFPAQSITVLVVPTS